jgi:large subunit ribosomal protein L10e
MALRKACAYSKKYARPYTRKSKKRNKSYVKTIPQQKIVKFHMGNTKAFSKGRYPFILKLISKEKAMIRDNAIEACRQVVNKDLEKNLPKAYYFSIKKFPHHILRENRMYSGGSKGERVNTGMSQSFGTVIGRAAFINSDDVIFIVAFAEKKSLPLVRKAFKKIKPKLACATKAVLEMKKKQTSK